MPTIEKIENEEAAAQNIFPKKYMKKLQTLAPEFTDEVNAMDTEEVKKRILTAEGNIYEIEQEKETNLKLLDAKERLKEMTAPFAEAKGLETAKIKYCLFTMETRGVRA